MRETTVPLPELALIAGTRALFGAGVGLLLASRLSEDQRKAVGLTLLAVGVATTFPLVYDVFSRSRTMSFPAMRG